MSFADGFWTIIVAVVLIVFATGLIAGLTYGAWWLLWRALQCVSVCRCVVGCAWDDLCERWSKWRKGDV